MTHVFALVWIYAVMLPGGKLEEHTKYYPMPFESAQACNSAAVNLGRESATLGQTYAYNRVACIPVLKGWNI